jgi:hypothetical protein
MHIEVFAQQSNRSYDAPDWYWHFRSKGRITADSEGFPTKAHAMRAAKGLVRAVTKNMSGFMLPRFTTQPMDRKGVVKITWR